MSDSNIGKAHFVNRELSWLEFNRRVLEEAQDENKPLLERAQFLAIVSSNLDEFFMVRVAQLHDLEAVLDNDPAGMSRQEQLQGVRQMSQQLIEDQSRCWLESIKPALQAEGVHIARADEWSDEDRATLRQLYSDRIEATLTPLAVDGGRPLPLIANGSIYIALELLEKKPAAEPVNALIAVPKKNRLLRLLGERHAYATLEDVIAYCADSLFPGFKVQAHCKIRVTRDGSLDIDEDTASDLLSEIEQELQHRGQGNPVRLEIESSAPDNLRQWIQQCLQISDEDVFPVPGLLDFTVLYALYNKESKNHAHLCEEEHHPSPCPVDWQDPFAAIREQELLLYHPYQSYMPVVDLIRDAASDDEVLAIKMTLYRAGSNSPIIKHLIDAAHGGKQVTVMVELKARFDEKANIQWARRLEDAGAHVIYGIVGLKVHAKLLLIIRHDEDGIRRYCHLGTGNYNHKTAKLYTDYSYFTCNEAIGRDVAALFNMLTGFAQPPQWERLEVSPLTLRDHFYQWIRQEITHAQAGRPAMIKAKFNSLVDEEICRELYLASQAGVTIQLVVRGICILRPGMKGVSENIEVRSVIGRFLEHSRFYYFHNNAQPIMGIASADWMTRNLDRRIEFMVRVTDAKIQQQLLDTFDMFQQDNMQARIMNADGSYRRMTPATGEEPFAAQPRMIDRAPAVVELVQQDQAGRILFTPLTSQRKKK